MSDHGEMDDVDSQATNVGFEEDDLMETQIAFEDHDEEQLARVKLTCVAEAPGAKVTEYALPVPTAGQPVIVPIGRLRLPDFLSNKGKMPSALVGIDESSISGLFELLDENRLQQRQQQWTSRMHGALRLTLLPNDLQRVEIMEFARQQTLPLLQRAQVKRSADFAFKMEPDKWHVLEHGDIVTFCPKVGTVAQTTDYDVFQYVVELPVPPAIHHRALHIRFVLPGPSLGKVIGKQGRVKQGIDSKHQDIVFDIANRQALYPGVNHGRAVMVSATSEGAFSSALVDILETAEIDKINGFHLVLPDATIAKILPDDEACRRIAGHHQVALQLLPAAYTDPPLEERLLLCQGGSTQTWTDLLLRVARANCPHQPYKNPISLVRPGLARDRSPPRHQVHSKPVRDNAARRGRNKTRNVQFRIAKRTGRSMHNQHGGRSRGKGKTKKKNK
jgi:hypothetical protein